MIVNKKVYSKNGVILLWVTKQLEQILPPKLDFSNSSDYNDDTLIFSVHDETTVKDLIYFIHLLKKDSAVLIPLYKGFLSKNNHFAIDIKNNLATTAHINTLLYDYRKIDFRDYSNKDTYLARKFGNRYRLTGTTIFDIIAEKQTKLLKRNLTRKHEKIKRSMRYYTSGLPKYTKGFLNWVHFDIMSYSNFFFYKYQRGKLIAGVCSVCGSTITLPYGVRSSKGACPNCKRMLTYRPTISKNRSFNWDTVVSMNTVNNVIWIQIHRIMKSFEKLEQTVRIQPLFLIRVQLGDFKCFKWDYFAPINKYTWCFTSSNDLFYYLRSKRVSSCYNFNKSKLESIIGLKLQDDISIMHLIGIFANNTCESLYKMNNAELANNILANWWYNPVITKNMKIHKSLGIKREFTKYLPWVSYSQLSVLKYLTNTEVQIKGNLEKMLLDNFRGATILLMNSLGENIVLDYLNAQKSLCGSFETAQIFLDDYLMTFVNDETLLTLTKKELKNKLLPSNLVTAHNYATKYKHIKCDNVRLQKVCATYTKTYQYTDDMYTVIAPTDFTSLLTESATLDHCVATYTNRIINGTSVILFLRENSFPDRPFYTLECRGLKVVQCRGYKNRNPPEEVKQFLNTYEKYLERI